MNNDQMSTTATLFGSLVSLYTGLTVPQFSLIIPGGVGSYALGKFQPANAQTGNLMLKIAMGIVETADTETAII